MAVTESDRILGAGVPLTLSDGREVKLRYGMRALKMLEDHFGSLTEIEKAVAGENSKQIDALMFLLAAGLHHEGISADEMLDLTDPAELESYADSITEAFEQAFPQAGKAMEDASRKGSRGKTGTSSRASTSVTPIASSGG